MCIDKSVIEAEKEYLVNVLGKNLIDSNERDDRKFPTGYRELAMKYWPEEFENSEWKDVHHIDFDRTNNVVSNLVVLTRSEHKKVHYLFDPSYEDIKQKISNACKGENNGFYGHKHKPESLAKMSVKGKHWKLSEETKKKISEALKNRKPISEETRQKMSTSHRGKPSWNKGKQISEEARKKMSNTHKTMYRVYHPDGTWHMEKKREQ